MRQANSTTTLLYIALGTVVLLGVIGCASPYRSVALGTAPAQIGSAQVAGGVPVDASSDRFQIAFHVTTSEATELEVLVQCPGGEHLSTVGESMASYRERRLGELRSQAQKRQQERERAASAVSAAVSTVAVVDTPVVQGEASVSIDATAVAVAEAPVELGPYDRGAQSIHQTIVLPGGGAGQCSMRLMPLANAPALRGVSGYMEVTHLIDKAQARARAKQRDDEVALRFRGTVKAELIARGADPLLRRRQKQAALEAAQLAAREAEAARVARAREERQRRDAELALVREQRRLRDAKLQAEAALQARVVVPAPEIVVAVPAPEIVVAVQVPKPKPKVAVQVPAPKIKLDLEANLRAEERARDLSLRARIARECVGGGADPYYRARQRQARFERMQEEELRLDLQVQAEIEAQREKERRLQAALIVDLEARETLMAHLIARGADPEYRRKQNEADLLSFEDRSRRAQLEAQRRASASLAAEAEIREQAEVSSEFSVSVAATAPRPPARTETRPPAPSAQAAWIAGFYQWQGGAWIWVPGLWSTPPVQDAVWVPTVQIDLGGELVVRPGSWRTRAGKRVGAPRPKVRDHRR